MRRPFTRKSRLQRMLDAVRDIDVPSPSLPRGRAGKAGLIAAGGLTGLTAGSAGLSSLRRRHGGGDDDG